MCGFIALLGLDGASVGKDVQNELLGALERLHHRGPDAQGIWVDQHQQCAMGHCRLAINDLSPEGEQPLHSSDGLIHAVVNGEIYDYDRVRAELEAIPGLDYKWKGRSDSELVLALYLAYGTSFLSHLRGEFALVLHDERTKLFLAARDRFGIKPLFWRRGSEGRLMLAAEAKAFLPLGWEPEFDVGAIVDGGWGHDMRTMFKGVNKIRPGHYLISRDGGTPEIRTYWDAGYPDKRLPEPRSEEEMIEQVRSLLVEATRLRLRADVPVGIYLSGGIDSSAIAGIAAKLVKEGTTMGSQSARERIACFSIAFDAESGFDESQISMRTANHVDVDFFKVHMSEAELAKRFEDAVYHIEHQPYELNFVGKYALSELTRQHGYKVVLTGEGSDEHFAGYPLYQPDYVREADHSWHTDLQFLSDEKRAETTQAMVDRILQTYRVIGAQAEYFTPHPALAELNNISTTSCLVAFVQSRTLFADWVQAKYAQVDPRDMVANNIDAETKVKIREKWHPLHSAMYVWSKGHLANLLLSMLGDRVEMAHSVEARTPFLDHVLAEYVNALPPSLKVKWYPNPEADSAEAAVAHGGSGSITGGRFVEKYILREAVKPFITQEVYERTKFPYSAPSTYPLDGPIHNLFKGILTREKVEALGFTNWPEVESQFKNAFGTPPEGDAAARASQSKAFRLILLVASWVILADKFGVKPAKPAP